MKVFLNSDKQLEINLQNYYIKQSDSALEITRQLFLRFINVIGEYPVFNNKTKTWDMIEIISNEYVFNRAVISFCNNFNLKCELPNYMKNDTIDTTSLSSYQMQNPEKNDKS